jgi:NhaP-type Na+/H+ or K+/H+ antiporter
MVLATIFQAQSGLILCLIRHHIKGAFPQALLLAGPGVLLGAFTMGSFVYGLELDWSWNLCMLFGSIVAATDPVAVVGLLKSTSASPKLTMLIVGESLLNDGTAMVLFSLYFELLKGHDYSNSFMMGFFLKMAVSSPLFGILMGLIAVHFMSYATKPMSSDDVTVQIAITFCCAYMTFFLAEYEMHISGLLACCGAGSMIAWKSSPLILQHESMHQVWGIMEWLGNTLLFLMAGCIIGSDVVSSRSASDWGHLVLLYIILIIVRSLIIFTLYPLLSRVGLKCSKEDAAFMAWTGLRGALGMALALIVKHERQDIGVSEKDSEQLFFFVGGLAALTLVVNATTAEWLLQRLGLLKKDTPDKVLVMDQIRKRLRTRLMKSATSLQEELQIQDINDIIQHNSLLKYSEGSEDDVPHSSSSSPAPSATSRVSRKALLRRSFSRRSGTDEPADDLLGYIRTIFLDIIRVEYWRRIGNGRLPRFSNSTEMLLYSIDSALDSVNKKLSDWDCLLREMDLPEFVQCGSTIVEEMTSELSSFRATVDVAKSQNEEYRVYVLTNFIEAQEVAQKKIFQFMGLEEEEAEEGGYKLPETYEVLKESKAAVSQCRHVAEGMLRHPILCVCVGY